MCTFRVFSNAVHSNSAPDSRLRALSFQWRRGSECLEHDCILTADINDLTLFDQSGDSRGTSLKHAVLSCSIGLCLCFLRPPGGHAGSHGKLQHHSEGAEAALQYAEGRQRHLGELVEHEEDFLDCVRFSVCCWY